MNLKSLSLQNFRSYPKKKFEFPSGTTLVVGPNASGKTNLLEAIYLLATGRSFRAGLTQEMIKYGKEIARVQGKVKGEEGTEGLEIILTPGQVGGEKAQKRKYLLNGVAKRMTDFVGHLRVVYFGPEDLEIVVDSPSIRRNWLDSVLEQVDWEYRRANLSYQKGLRQRNKLLEQIRERKRNRQALFFWDKLLVENGEKVTTKRGELIEFINQQPDYFDDLTIQYRKSVISPQQLAKYAQKEVVAGMTLVGPHRDDFEMKTKKRSLHIFGSRGEQRTAVFSLKLAELEFMAEQTDGRPVLLLDDIFSELDQEHRQRLLEVIPRQQTIITTTDLRLVGRDYRKKFEVIRLKSTE